MGVLPPTPTPEKTLAPANTPTQDEPPASLGMTIVNLLPEDGDLLTQLEGQAPKASALGQHMFVEFDASW